ncbi:MAG: PAS domain S-box protein [Nitrospirae bacterium]|nr:MAG: PAS domain S-box protein [Nitrospirota bacterium]
MKDDHRTKTELVAELTALRRRVAKLERMEARQKVLEETWKRYDFIVNTSKDYLSLIDRNYRYVAANDAYCRAQNRTREEIIDSTVSEIWGRAAFQKVIKKQLDYCFAGEEVRYKGRFRFAAAGPTDMDIIYYPYFDNRGIVTHAVVVSRDITEQQKAEQELLSLKKAVETMQLGVTITDTRGRIIYTNPAEAAMHSYSLKELKKKNVRVFAPDSLWRTRTIESLQEIKSWRRESVNIRKDGSSFPVQLMSDVVRNEEDTPIGIVTTCEDITDRKRADDQIRLHMQHLTTLREIDTVILSSLDLKVILNVLLNHLVSQLNVDAAAIMLLNPHTLTLEYAEGRGFRSPNFRKAQMRLGEGLAGRVALERRLIALPDFSNGGPAPLNSPHLEQEGLASYFGLPLIAKGQVKGTLELFTRSKIEPGTEWLEFLEALAAQAAIAIDNATMFHDLQRSNVELSLAYDTTLDGWSRALDLRDKETEGHSRRVTEITLVIAKAMGISEAEMVHMQRGALLHDIGKLGIPDRILHKPGPLTPEEWEIMKLHPAHAYDMLSPINFLRPAIDIPYCHHEKWDGSGYPRGLQEEKIPLPARIFAIADIWDALCSVRPYRDAFDKGKALKHMRGLESSHLDPAVLKVFLEIHG